MDIFEYLEELQEDIFSLHVSQIESKYYEICVTLSSTNDAKRIQSVSLDVYKRKLSFGLYEALIIAKEESSEAIYYEYDLDNHWGGHFFVCDDYLPLKEQDDDWACDWTNEVEGPQFLEFAEMYSKNGFDTNQKAIGNTLYLIARTVCCFISVCNKRKSNIPICIGFHGQDPIMRMCRE